MLLAWSLRFRSSLCEWHLPDVFPHWNWSPTQKVDIWAFSNADEVELLVNGKSLGRATSQKYSHFEWNQVPFVAGEITANAYMNGSSTPVATQTRKTAGEAVALQASIKDGVGSPSLKAVRTPCFAASTTPRACSPPATSF